MRKWMKRLVLILGISVLFLISIIYGLIPVPLVPVFNPKSLWPVGFLTCQQLEQRTFYRCNTSGEFIGCEPFLGVRAPLIYELTFSRNCPEYTPPQYCGNC